MKRAAFEIADEEANQQRRITSPVDPKLIRTDDDIRNAVNDWCDNRSTALEIYGHISEWDTSRVTSTSSLFADKKYFNNDISKWNVSKVTDMSYMFSGASSFNQPLSASGFMECE